MTIKEVEQRLEIPRATVRFYEKEGLLSPVRGENGYREYSEEDVVLLKKIIIFRKLGFAVSDIEDVLDGAKSMSDALETNMENLTRQMQELQGALTLCRKMRENGEQIETFDAEKYWNAVEEEEKKGNRFLDIAKDVVRFEKATVLEFFDLEYHDWESANSIPKALMKIVKLTLLVGFLWCLLKWSFDMDTFKDAMFWMVTTLFVEVIVAIPTYFILKKHPGTNKRKIRLLLASCLWAVLLVVMLVSWVVK